MSLSSTMTRRDPSNPGSFNHRKAALTTGITYHFIDEFDESLGTFESTATPTLLCMHGFPDLWYGWRHQIAPWVSQGWRVVVPDMIGYGQTDKPNDVKRYTTKSIADDMAALLDFIGVRKAFILGHDWGSAIAWRFGMWHPDRCRGIVNLAIPYAPPQQEYRSIEDIAKIMPDFGYQVYFSDPRSTAELESNLNIFFAAIYQTPASPYRRPMTKLGVLETYFHEKKGSIDWADVWNAELTPDEIAFVLKNYREGGMNGPLNYYRTTKLRYEEEKGKLSAKLPTYIPWLLIYGERDPTCSMSRVASTKKYAPQIQTLKLDNVGHWVMIEARDTVTQAVIDFVQKEKLPAKL